MARRSSPVVTASEAVAVLRAVDPRIAGDLTERQFRYRAQALGINPTLGRGSATLYDVIDLALVRFALRLFASGISQRLAQSGSAYLAHAVRELLVSGRAAGAVVVVPTGDAVQYPRRDWPRLVSAADAERAGGVQIPLRDIADGLAPRMRAIRAHQPTVWQFRSVQASTAAARLELTQPDSMECLMTL